MNQFDDIPPEPSASVSSAVRARICLNGSMARAWAAAAERQGRLADAIRWLETAKDLTVSRRRRERDDEWIAVFQQRLERQGCRGVLSG